MGIVHQSGSGACGARFAPPLRWIAACSVLCLSAAPAAAETVEAIVEQEVIENDTSASIQERIDEIAEDTEAMQQEYKTALQNIRQLNVYNRQLESLVDTQQAEIVSVRRQIDDVTVVGRQVLPHMERMIDVLDQFVSLDLPFLMEERRKRVDGLREMLTQADVTISEKYRRILESYQIENEYGRSIEAYSGTLDADGTTRTVDFLRIGRNALLYQTLDGAEQGAYDRSSGNWVALGNRYRSSVREGLRMARKQTAPNLIEVPLPAPEVVQ